MNYIELFTSIATAMLLLFMERAKLELRRESGN
jgi:hypothetical protein